MASISERLVHLANEIRFETLPGEVVRESERRLLDAIGGMMAGASGSTTLQVAKAVIGLHGASESSLFGTDHLTSCEKATLVNCTALRFLDYMDGHFGAYPCHPCFNIPPILAVAEKVGASGEDVVTDIVRSYEIMARLQENAGLPDLGSRGWAGSTNLAFSVPLGISPLLGLNHEQTVNALGISITHGSVLNAASDGQMPTSKSILDGMTAMNAVVAALLAKQGVSGPHGAIEGKGGYVNGVAGSCNYDNLLAPIGRHKILETYTKLYNTVQCGQTAVAAAFELVQNHRIKTCDIAEVRIGLARRDAASQTRDPSSTRPKSRDTANHSVRYCVAAALVEGELTADQFEPEKLCSREILDLVDRMAIYRDESQESHWPLANPATVTITTGGQEFSKTLVFPPGHPNNPLPDNVLEEKFRKLTRRILDAGRADKVIALTRHLPDLPDIHELTDLLRPTGKD